ncbi:MAG: hypothetical protein QGG42_00010 [Phycisphaerae bacterium]|nr:hypothetical protein [Phycisphaerae bacterium]
MRLTYRFILVESAEGIGPTFSFTIALERQPVGWRRNCGVGRRIESTTSTIA